MFSDISPEMLSRMNWLEKIDAEDRKDGTPRQRRLRQIPPETGRFIALMAACSPPGSCLEIGTSAGYSTLWLSLACKATGRHITTIEVLEEKAALAKETFRLAGVEDIVDFVNTDAHPYLETCPEISFCFLDAEKEEYEGYYDLIVNRLVPGGLLVADNVISHADFLREFTSRALSDDRVDAVVVPIGKVELLCRRV